MHYSEPFLYDRPLRPVRPGPYGYRPDGRYPAGGG